MVIFGAPAKPLTKNGLGKNSHLPGLCLFEIWNSCLSQLADPPLEGEIVGIKMGRGGEALNEGGAGDLTIAAISRWLSALPLQSPVERAWAFSPLLISRTSVL